MRYVSAYVEFDAVKSWSEKTSSLAPKSIHADARYYSTIHGLLEVETPILQAFMCGAAARPFDTQHNTLDMPAFLTNCEMNCNLKRLIVGGFDGVMQFWENVPKRRHGPNANNPEFNFDGNSTCLQRLHLDDRKMWSELNRQVTRQIHGKQKFL